MAQFCWFIIVNLCYTFMSVDANTLPAKNDLLFIVDTSTGMGTDDLKLAVQFMEDLLEFYSINPGTTRVALYTVAGDKSHEHFRFKTFTNRVCVVKNIRKLTSKDNKPLNAKKRSISSQLFLDIYSHMCEQNKMVLGQRKTILFLTNSRIEAKKANACFTQEISSSPTDKQDTTMKSILLRNFKGDQRRSILRRSIEKQRDSVEKALKEQEDLVRLTIDARAQESLSDTAPLELETSGYDDESERESKRIDKKNETVNKFDDDLKMDEDEVDNNYSDADDNDNDGANNDIDSDDNDDGDDGEYNENNGDSSVERFERVKNRINSIAVDIPKIKQNLGIMDSENTETSIMKFDRSSGSMRKIIKQLNRRAHMFTRCIVRNDDTENKEHLDECNNRCECIDGMLKNCKRVRKEITSLTDEERIRYFRAYKTLTSTNPYKERYEKLAFMHPKYFCWGIHKKELFLPWHRNYLREMENLLQEIDCRVKIVYWDWSLRSEDPWNNETWDQSDMGLGGDGDRDRGFCVQNGFFSERKWKTPFWETSFQIMEATIEENNLTMAEYKPRMSNCLRRCFNGETPSRLHVKNTLDLPPENFTDFDINMRLNFHNFIHNSVSGTMGSMYSSLAPEFWMHHAMLDNIWYTWQLKSTENKNVYHKKRNKSSMAGFKYTESELVDLHNMPGCESATYDTLEFDDDVGAEDEESAIRSIDDVDWSSHKPASYFAEKMRKARGGSFINCTVSDEEHKRSIHLMKVLDGNYWKRPRRPGL